MKGGRSARMGEGEGQRRSSHKRKGCCQCGCAIEEGMLLQGCVVEGDAIAGWEKEEGGENFIKSVIVFLLNNGRCKINIEKSYYYVPIFYLKGRPSMAKNNGSQHVFIALYFNFTTCSIF